MNPYRAIFLGATGEVGSAVLKFLQQSKLCEQVSIITRRDIDKSLDLKVKVVKMDTSADDFSDNIAKYANEQKCNIAISCAGVGAGTYKWSEEELYKNEVVLLEKYCQGCKHAGINKFLLLTAVGEASADSWFSYSRILYGKERVAISSKFNSLAIFKPGIIVGNVHTPGWISFLAKIMSDDNDWSNVEQEDIARAFLGFIELNEEKKEDSSNIEGNFDNTSVKRFVNTDIRKLSMEWAKTQEELAS